MKRSTRYTLKYATKEKKNLINLLFKLYSHYFQKTINLIWEKKVPLRKWMSTKDIDWMDNLGGQYKQLIYQHASAIVRSCRFKKGQKSKPQIKNFSINFTQNQISIEQSHNSFDKWIRLKLPFIQEEYKNKRIEILIPVKEHKHSLKFKNWKQAKTIRLSLTYATVIFEKKEPPKKQRGKTIGIDQGYKKLIVTSNKQFIGRNMEKYYEKIARKKQGSKAFKRALRERNNEINRLLNRELNLRGIKEIKVEDLKNVKKNSHGKIRKEFNNKLQRWIYAYVLRKLYLICQLNRVMMTYVDPVGSSQTCAVCGFRHPSNRRGERFKCLNCGHEEDADFNASCIISSRESNVPDT